MAGVNKAILVGNLGRDPELRHTPNGQAVVNFTLATSESWTDKSGERQERTEWHRIVVWGRQAEMCNQYLSKGRTVYVEGRIQTREWEDKEGAKRYTTEINASSVNVKPNAMAVRTMPDANPTSRAPLSSAQPNRSPMQPSTRQANPQSTITLCKVRASM